MRNLNGMCPAPFINTVLLLTSSNFHNDRDDFCRGYERESGLVQHILAAGLRSFRGLATVAPAAVLQKEKDLVVGWIRKCRSQPCHYLGHHDVNASSCNSRYQRVDMPTIPQLDVLVPSQNFVWPECLGEITDHHVHCSIAFAPGNDLDDSYMCLCQITVCDLCHGCTGWRRLCARTFSCSLSSRVLNMLSADTINFCIPGCDGPSAPSNAAHVPSARAVADTRSPCPLYFAIIESRILKLSSHRTAASACQSSSLCKRFANLQQCQSR